MLITRLGQARERLLESFAALSDADLNRIPAGRPWSIAAILRHVAAWEQDLADRVLEAAEGRRIEAVAGRSEDDLRAALAATEEQALPAGDPSSAAELVHALGASRFAHLQRVFNKAHARALAERSLVAAPFGRISLENAVDLIWLHDELHARQIEAARAALAPADS